MCKTQSEGGRRCHAHAQQRVVKAQKKLVEKPSGKSRAEFLQAVGERASTPTALRETEVAVLAKAYEVAEGTGSVSELQKLRYSLEEQKTLAELSPEEFRQKGKVSRHIVSYLKTLPENESGGIVSRTLEAFERQENFDDFLDMKERMGGSFERYFDASDEDYSYYCESVEMDSISNEVRPVISVEPSKATVSLVENIYEVNDFDPERRPTEAEAQEMARRSNDSFYEHYENYFHNAVDSGGLSSRFHEARGFDSNQTVPRFQVKRSEVLDSDDFLSAWDELYGE